MGSLRERGLCLDAERERLLVWGPKAGPQLFSGSCVIPQDLALPVQMGSMCVGGGCPTGNSCPVGKGCP